MNYRNISLFGIVFILLVGVGFVQSWSVAFALVNLCLLSSVMALGVNIQWGYAGLFSVGTMGFVALGGLATVITSMPPVAEA
ncbi:MAG: branched-chain amino acid ABC transporter permease, partial [Rhodobacteraceae bacterium]|nr:branched-chain amino acid ABC transporter permease [Paracoccaceae bacterium]